MNSQNRNLPPAKTTAAKTDRRKSTCYCLCLLIILIRHLLRCCFFFFLLFFLFCGSRRFYRLRCSCVIVWCVRERGSFDSGSACQVSLLLSHSPRLTASKLYLQEFSLCRLRSISLAIATVDSSLLLLTIGLLTSIINSSVFFFFLYFGWWAICFRIFFWWFFSLSSMVTGLMSTWFIRTWILCSATSYMLTHCVLIGSPGTRMLLFLLV